MAYKQKKSPVKGVKLDKEKLIKLGGRAMAITNPFLAQPLMAADYLENKGYTDFYTSGEEQAEIDKQEEANQAMQDKGIINAKRGETIKDLKENEYKQKDTTGFYASDDYGKSTSDKSAELKSVYRMRGSPMKRNFPKHIKK